MKRSLTVVLLLAVLYLAFDHQGIFAGANAQLSKSPALAGVSGLLKTFVVGGVNAAAPRLDRAAAQQKGLEHLARYAQEKGYVTVPNNIPAKTYTVTIRATDNCGAISDRPFTLTAGCQTITVTNPATTPAGGSYTFAVMAGTLPAGLTLAANGALTGTPTTAGTFSFTITATGFGSCAKAQAYSLVINAACTAITVNPATLSAEKAGVAYSQQLTANIAGTYSLQAGTFPAGLTLSSAELISGTPTITGSFNITVLLTAGTCTGTRAYTLTTSAGALAAGTALAQMADYDGDGKTDIAVWRGSDGKWYILRSSDGEVDVQTWGLASVDDLPVPGDYDGDGKTDIAVWRGADTNWYIVQSSDNAIKSVSWGGSLMGDVSVPGDYDGDCKADVAVWRESTGMWYVKRISDDTVMSKTYGQSGDVPIVAGKNN